MLHVEKIGALTGVDPARWPNMRIVEPADRRADCAKLHRMAEPDARLPKEMLKTGYTQLYVNAVHMVLRAQRP